MINIKAGMPLAVRRWWSQRWSWQPSATKKERRYRKKQKQNFIFH
jgi:hypothetical protein